jgi:transposase
MCLYVTITDPQANYLLHTLRHTNDVFKFKRSQIILASAQQMRVQEISAVFCYSEDYVKTVIKEFNQIGLSSIKSARKNNHRPPKFTREERDRIVEVALKRPQDLGLPFTQWSLNKLREQVLKQGIVENISIDTIHTILKQRKIGYKRTKTWKESHDPCYETKKRSYSTCTSTPHWTDESSVMTSSAPSK